MRLNIIIRDDAEALALWHKAMATKRGPKPKANDSFVDNINEIEAAESREKGTSRAYTVSRLQSQRPDLFEQVSYLQEPRGEGRLS